MACSLFKENKLLINIISIAKIHSNFDKVFKMEVEKVCKENCNKFDFSAEINEALKSDDERRKLCEEFRDCIIANID